MGVEVRGERELGWAVALGSLFADGVVGVGPWRRRVEGEGFLRGLLS
jgi:hypothetical protein